MTRVVALAPDLFFASKIEATLTAAGHDVTIHSSTPLPEEGEVVIVDLDHVDPSLPLPPGARKLGFYSHTDVETRERAEGLGFDLVVPRSRMARDMPALVEQLANR